jgi:DHA1 family bicyclomycin/chloramphenicol resistance-like MFS transporter
MNSPRSSAWLVLLGVLTAIAPLSIDMYLPSFPRIEHALGSRPGSVELTLASFFIGMTLGQLFYGPVSDRFGRKRPLYAGLLIYTLASLGAASSHGMAELVAWRFLQGLGGCAGIVIPRAIVRDRTTARELARAFSMLMLVMGLAPILAPLLGGALLLAWGWRGIFVSLAMFGAVCLAGVGFGLSESHDTEHEPPLRLIGVLGNYAGLLRNRAFLGYALGGGMAMSGMFAYIAGSPFVLIDLYGIAPQRYGLFFGANAIGLIGVSQLNAWLLKKYPGTTLLRIALWVPALTGLALAALTLGGWITLPWFVVGFFCFVSSLGCIMPNAMASALATHGQQAGTASALASALQFLLATLAGSMVGILRDGSGRPLAGIMALCGVGAWLSHRLLVAHHAERQATESPTGA